MTSSARDVGVRASSRLRILLALAASSAALVACNAIVGVEDVTLRTRDAGRRVDESGGDEESDPDNPDVDAPTEDRGELALGFNHACARLPSGTVRCWGDNGAGQVGDGVPFDGSRPDVLKPQDVPGIKDAVAIAAGVSHTCVVHKPGTVSCWGSNFFGQLGDGTVERSSAPVKVLGLQNATTLAGGTSFTCALRTDKTVACWGANYSGQLGDGLKVDRPTATPVKNLTGAIGIAAASDHACAVLEGGDVVCWGGNTEGQLGIGSTTESLAPTKLNALSEIAQVAAAARFSCARQTSGRVYCWGNNEFGQLGNGSPTTAPNPSPLVVPSVGDAVFIWTGIEHACAVRKTGAVACWGAAGEGQLGKGAVAANTSIATPVAVVGLPDAVAVWTGGTRSCSIVGDGRAFCWGQNSTGQLGNGTTTMAYTAVPVSNFP
ncbi:MAG: repeat domain protein [Labilithrix sp.]|nr:repeat domain protein [Labilithrix sp.]